MAKQVASTETVGRFAIGWSVENGSGTFDRPVGINSLRGFLPVYFIAPFGRIAWARTTRRQPLAKGMAAAAAAADICRALARNDRRR